MEFSKKSAPTDERVQDINKAREMAYAEKPYRDKIEAKTEQIDKESAVNPDYELAGESLLEIAELNSKANAAARRTEKQYDLIHKLQNGEQLNKEELARIEKIKEQPWAEDSRFADNDVERERYKQGALTLEEVKDFIQYGAQGRAEGEIPSSWDSEAYWNEKNFAWRLRREGKSKEQVVEAIGNRRHKIERLYALVDRYDPLHDDMRRTYDKIKKNQAEKVKKLREDLEVKKKELSKFEESGIEKDDLRMYTFEIETICEKLDALEEYAREEAFQMAKLYERIRQARSDISPVYSAKEKIREELGIWKQLTPASLVEQFTSDIKE